MLSDMSVPRPAVACAVFVLSGVLFSGLPEARAQEAIASTAVASPQNAKSPQSVLRDLETAFAAGDAQRIRKQLSPKTFLNFLTGENGYFSTEQSFFILKNFFALCGPVSFSLSSSNLDEENPYGIGSYQYFRRGRRETAQIFLSLTRAQDDWKLTQITIAKR